MVLSKRQTFITLLHSCFSSAKPWAYVETVIHRSGPSLQVLRALGVSHGFGDASHRCLYSADMPEWLSSCLPRLPLQHQ